VAPVRQANPFPVSAAKYFCYACEIKETTNGRWRGACSQTWQAVEVIAAGRIEKHV